jgi:hypothetical protein
MNKLALMILGVLSLGTTYANTTPSALCGSPLSFSNGAASPTPVSCPPFNVPGATLTAATLSYRADYQFGNLGTTNIAVTFAPAGPGGVTWTPSSQTLNVLNDAAMDGSSGGEPSGGSNATAGVSNAAFASAFNVNISSSVVTGSVLTSSGSVSIVYTYTPALALTLSCPASTGTVGTPYSSALVAAGGVPAYGPYAIVSGSISPLTLNTGTGAITGTPTTAGTLTFTAMVTDSIGDTATTGATACTITIGGAPPPPTGMCNASAVVFSPEGPADAFQVRYAANLNIGDSVINITNSDGGSIGVNVYVFDPSEELISCCTCLLTPNALQSLSVKNSLISNTLIPVTPTAVVIKLVACVPGTGALASGLVAWGTTLHAVPTPAAAYGVTETRFTNGTLSAAELTRITSTCGFAQTDGSGFGICKGCAAGGLGAAIAQQ